MGLILPQIVKQKWAATSKQHYIDLGYAFTKIGDDFDVNVLDLSKSSSTEVSVECDFCNKTKLMPWRDYSNLRSSKYCCSDCLKHKKKTRTDDGELIFIEIPYRNKEWLENEYIVKNRDAKDIASECGVNLRTLREWISKFKLSKYRILKNMLSEDKLYDLYFVNHLTSEEIGEKYNVTGNTIISLLKEYGYEIPTRKELLSIYYEEKDGYRKCRDRQSTLENRIKSSCRQHGIDVKDFKCFSTTEQHMARNNTYYKEWQRNVFDRDDYTCQCCGKRGGNLNAHHLWNFSEYEDLRYDVDNGITFCEECHLVKYPNSFHSIYGERNNTPEQVKEFMENYRKNHKKTT